MIFLIFSGVLKPNSKDEAKNEAFNEMVEKSGAIYVVIGLLLVLISIYFLIRQVSG